MNMQDELKNKPARDLFAAILALNSPAECRAFFRDVCSLPEVNAMAERFQIAKLVATGMPYREISRKTGSSTATITRVAHWLHYGTGGYRLALDRTK